MAHAVIGRAFFIRSPIDMARVPTVKIKAPDRYPGDYLIINESDYDPDEHTLYEEATAPSDALVEVVGTRYAKALAKGGITTLDAARALSEEEVNDLPGVGSATYEALHDSADE